MGAYECRTCQVWMPAQEASKCPKCGTALIWSATAEVGDPDWRRTLGLDPSPDPVAAWRLHNLLRIGVATVEAEHLAERDDVDWHEIDRLTRAGCPVETAVEICA